MFGPKLVIVFLPSGICFEPFLLCMICILVERPSKVLEVAAHIVTAISAGNSSRGSKIAITINSISVSSQQLSRRTASCIKGGKVKTGRLIVATRTEEVVVQWVDACRCRAHGRPYVVCPLVMTVVTVVVRTAVQTTSASGSSCGGRVKWLWVVVRATHAWGGSVVVGRVARLTPRSWVLLLTTVSVCSGWLWRSCWRGWQWRWLEVEEAICGEEGMKSKVYFNFKFIAIY